MSKGNEKQRSLENRLRKARSFYDQEKFSDAGSEICSLLSDMPSGIDVDTRADALLLGLFSFARSGRIASHRRGK